ncbi:hypothetical protein [Mariprofundus ferrooxydans]|nr:hypothetical protein [Mariprofundus ferrooxydans]
MSYKATSQMMEEWLPIIIRQLILYSLPVLVSLTCVAMFESRFTGSSQPHPFSAIAGRAVWLPLLASMAFHRGMIITLNGQMGRGGKAAATRLIAHLLLCLTGFLLYTWSLSHTAPVGLPPLHHWWAKVLMFFNLCMASMHLLPLPGQLFGEALLQSRYGTIIASAFEQRYAWLIMTLLAASPLLDLLLGTTLVFPVYESISSSAMHWSQQTG